MKRQPAADPTSAMLLNQHGPNHLMRNAAHAIKGDHTPEKQAKLGRVQWRYAGFAVIDGNGIVGGRSGDQ